MGIDLKDKYNELINRPISISPDSIAELGRGFYTSTTKEQEDMMQNRNYGVVLVEGVAGSGKTSIALGRAKMLVDRDRTKAENERNYVLENMIGFVPDKQLIQYLETTRNRLHLNSMSIFSFREYRNDLMKLHASLIGLRKIKMGIMHIMSKV